MLFIGSCSGNLYALDRRTGQLRWSYDVRQDGAREFHGDPLVTDKLLIIGADGEQRGWLYAFDRETGELQWKIAPGSGTPGGVGFTTDLLSFRDSVVAGAFGDFIASVDIATGLTNWEFQGGFDGSRRLFPSSPALADGFLYFGGQDGRLHALEAATGQLRWKTDFGARVNTAVVTDGNEIYVGTEDGKFRKIAADGGAAVASMTLLDVPGYKPLLWNDVLFVMNGEKRISALDRELRILWNSEDPSGWDSPRPRIWNGSLILGSSDGRLVALDPASGSERWSLRLGKSPVRGIGADEQTLYAGMLNGQLFAVRVNTSSQ